MENLKKHPNTSSSQPRNLENISITHTCHTKKISDIVYECLMKTPYPEFCKFSVQFGKKFYCAHPISEKFAVDE